MITSKRGYFRDSRFGPIGLTSGIRDLYIWDPRISKFRFWDCFKYSDFGNRSLSAPITLCPRHIWGHGFVKVGDTDLKRRFQLSWCEIINYSIITII